MSGPLIRCGALALAVAVVGPAAGRLDAGRGGQGVELRLLASNVHHGEGTDGRLDLERIAALIASHEPDLVALQEIDVGTERTGRIDQAGRLAALTGMEARFGEFMSYQGGQYGMAVLSRLTILEATNHRLPPGAEPRSALAVRVRLPQPRTAPLAGSLAPGADAAPEAALRATELVFVDIHLYRTEEERLAQARRLVEALATETVPVILAGDFNSTPGSPVMQLLERHWSVPVKRGDRRTFSSTEPTREIDFLLLRPADRFEVLEYRVIDEPLASDHRPVLMVVRLR